MSKCEKKCGDCIHCDICLNIDRLTLFDKNQPAYCKAFKDKSLFVEVVRCKDCVHRYEPVRCALWYATVGDKEYFSERGEDFYCKWGETQATVEAKLKELGV